MADTFKYMRDHPEDTYGFLPLQDKILEIMMYIDSFCREHGIEYWLMGGSALGAMRHQGYIPWDDDLDIFMDFRNYARFEECCEKYLDTSRFYFQKRDTDELPYFYSKIRMNGTKYVEEANANRPDMHQGIFVDIMCLNNAAPAGWRRKLQYCEAAVLRSYALTRVNYHTDDPKKARIIRLVRFFVGKGVKNLLLKDILKYNRRESDTLAHIFGRAKFENSYYPAADFAGQRYVPFEKVSLPVPSGAEDYLTIRYGPDYMSPPDEKTKAIYAAHAVEWDIGGNA